MGDIYEGLLGAHFVRVESGRLELRNQNGENHRNGIFYTPDWIVQFLIRETVSPLLHAIEASEEVQRARNAQSEEARRNNAFAHGVLRLNLVDPAMGSGHFLVRATEWLADRIMQHPTTHPMTEQVVSQGTRRATREDIIARHRIPVPAGVSQEQSEVSYWRRRVVEACIYGVDINPMAVELAKLSLWLTCIAVDEPLNFLDHHLRHGNALLSVAPAELRRAPVLANPDQEQTFDAGDHLHASLSAVIRETLAIEGEASTEMEVVKRKERQWRQARKELQPFLNVADLWLAAVAGVPMDELNYMQAARLLIAPDQLDSAAKRDAKRFLESIAEALEAKKKALTPFHWRLEFPDVFYAENGDELPAAGFDAVLGNPPYISTQTSSAEKWRDVLERREGYLDDLYVHFTNLGFQLLRAGGGFGFIISDTFFTLASKLKMRQLLQSQSLGWLGQCDPFDATVDAAVFVARKAAPTEDAQVLFLQARPLRRGDGTKTKPDKKLEFLPRTNALNWNEPPTLLADASTVRHATAHELRVHELPLSLYRNAHKEAFFEPRPGTLALYECFNEKIKDLVVEWWERIEDSREFANNIEAIKEHHRSLKPGDVTLVGLIAEGGQGLATGNNARFLAYLEGTPQARELEEKAAEWNTAWLADSQIAPVYRQAVTDAGGDVAHPTANRAAWEAAVHRLRNQFKPEKLRFSRMALFRIAPKNLIATEADFRFAFDQRKTELLRRWQQRPEFDAFWNEPLQVGGRTHTHTAFRRATEINDTDFCQLCQHLQIWIARENEARRQETRIPREAIGLRSSEDYDDPADGPRIATIYNGLSGRGQFVPYSKGDKDGNRWLDNTKLCCEWSKDAVEIISTSPLARWQGHRFFLTEGVSWSDTGNHVALKARLLPVSVNDVKSMRLTPVIPSISARAFLAILNSDVFSYLEKKFINNTCMYQVNDLRQLPIIIPSRKQNDRLDEFATLSVEAKRAEFANQPPANALVARAREIATELRAHAPAYLHPSAQQILLETPASCLAVLENAVNWEAEKLYGVPGLGPFDEF